MVFPEILTERVLIRNFRESDTDRIMQYRSTPECRKFLSWPKSIDELNQAIKNSGIDPTPGAWNQLGIAGKSDDFLLGDCAFRLSKEDSRIAEIGIAIAPEYHAQGYGHEALTALFNALFINFKVHRIFASVDPLNSSSCALMEKLKMRKEGIFKQSIWFRDRWVDDVIYALLQKEWTQQQPQSSASEN